MADLAAEPESAEDTAARPLRLKKKFYERELKRLQ